MFFYKYEDVPQRPARPCKRILGRFCWEGAFGVGLVPVFGRGFRPRQVPPTVVVPTGCGAGRRPPCGASCASADSSFV